MAEMRVYATVDEVQLQCTQTAAVAPQQWCAQYESVAWGSSQGGLSKGQPWLCRQLL